MKIGLRLFVVIQLILVGFVLCLSKAAYASFEKEYDRFNRQQSERALQDMDRELSLRIEEGKEAAEEEGLTQEEREARHEVAPAELELQKSGGLKIRPRFEYHFTRDSNVFQRTNDPDPEAISVYEPSVRLSMPLFQGWKYQANATVRYFDYLHYEHNSRPEHDYQQSFVYRANRLNLRIADDLGFFTFPTEDAKDKLTAVRNHNLAVNVDYRISPKTQVAGYYNHQMTTFLNDSEKGNSARNDKIGTRISYSLSRQSDVYADYSYRFSRPPKGIETDNINSQQIMVGFQGSLTPKLSASTGFGVEEKEFAAVDDKIGVVIEGVVRYAINPRTNLSISFSRDNVPVASETDVDPLNQTLGAMLTHQWDRRLSLHAGESLRLIQSGVIASAVDPDHPAILTTKEDESYFLSTNLGLDYQLLKDLAVGINYTYERVRNELKTANRISHITNVDATYQF